MTVPYSATVATARFSCFFKLLIRWRGSIYKILWKEFAVFSAAYFFLSLLYRFILTETQKRYFEKGAEYCAQFSNLIPVAFVLGFYVNHIASRWWEKFRTLPWPGRTAMFVTAHLLGHDERARLMRRTIMRYMCLSYVITMASISPPVKKRFPTWRHMTEAGLMLANEEKIMDNIKTPYNKFFVPLIWASALVTRARKEGMIKDDFAVKTLIDEINDFRTRSFQLFNFDWVNIPLVYTQVVTLAVYTFFLSCLMGRQYLDNGHLGDMYFPLFTFLQFFFYMGWLKVAETMLNPFGEDDDDFDINYLIDRNLKISYLVVDEMHAEHPELIRDQYWDTMEFDLPYTEETRQFKQAPHRGSALDLDVHHHEKVHNIPSSLNSILEEVNVPDGAADGGNQVAFSASTSVPRSIHSRSRRIPAFHSLQGTTQASYGNSIFQTHLSSTKDIASSTRSSTQQQQPLSRMTSRSSVNSQASDRSVGFFKSLKKSLAGKTRRQDSDETEECELKVRTKPRTLTPSIAGSFQSTDLPFLGLDIHRETLHDEMVFLMSDSDSEDSLDDPTNLNPSIKPTPRQSKRRPRSKEDLHGPITFRTLPHHHPHHHHHQHHLPDRRGSEPTTHSTSDHQLAKKSHSKEARGHKEDEHLFPIDEVPDDSVLNTSAERDKGQERDKNESFVSEIREKLHQLQDEQKVPHPERSTSVASAEADILSILGTSVRSTLGSSEQQRFQGTSVSGTLQSMDREPAAKVPP